MPNQRHIIGRTVVELDARNLADVWELQETTSRLLRQRAVPQLEQLFDDLVTDDEVVRLEQVVVNLEAIAPQVFEREFIPALVNALRQTLNDRLVQQPVETPTRQTRISADGEVLLYFLRYGRLPWWVTETAWPTWLRRWEAVVHQDTLWQRPLTRLLGAHPIAQERLIVQFPNDFRQQLIGRLRPAWTGCPTLLARARQILQTLGLSSTLRRELEREAWRLILQRLQVQAAVDAPFPASAWAHQWLAYLWRVWQTSRAGTLDATVQLAQLRAAIALMPKAERALWQSAFEQVSGEIPAEPPSIDSMSADPSARSDRVLDGEGTAPASDRWAPPGSPDPTPSSPSSELSSERGASADRSDSPPPPTALELSEDLPDSQDRMPVDGAEAADPGGDRPSSSQSSGSTPVLEKAASQIDPKATEREGDRANVDDGPPAPGQRNLSAMPNQPSASPSSDDSLLSPEEETARLYIPSAQSSGSDSLLSPEEETAGLYINQAGLVLLHPFLAAYLRGLDLASGNAFRDKTAQQTAIYLLHYLATRQTHAPEYDLVLPKLLCGWPLNEAIAADIPLPEAALAEGEILLRTVIGHWGALKNTSPDGLREGFLQREGKLTRTGERAWTLQVEQTAIDVLLNRLPWGVSMVKLPWMDILLTVEWT